MSSDHAEDGDDDAAHDDDDDEEDDDDDDDDNDEDVNSYGMTGVVVVTTEAQSTCATGAKPHCFALTYSTQLHCFAL